MSKIPFTRNSPQARQNQTPEQPVEGQPDLSAPTQHPLLEDPSALATRLEDSELFVRRNKNIVFGLLAVVVLAIVGAFGYYTWRTTQDDKAQTAMFQAVNYWETDSLKKAMKGDGLAGGLEGVTKEYSGTKAGNLANFYAGVASLKEGKFEQAIDFLEDFSSDDLIMQGRAYALIGDANMELKKYKEAADYYRKAADYKTNEYFTPGYLLKLAVAQEMLKDYAAAGEAYSKIVTEYPTSAESNEAKIYQARAKALAGGDAK